MHKSKNSRTGKGTVMAARAKKKTPTWKNAAKKIAATNHEQENSIESWICDALCSIRGAKDSPKYKNFIAPRHLPHPSSRMDDRENLC
jgi:hypothetical protein